LSCLLLREIIVCEPQGGFPRGLRPLDSRKEACHGAPPRDPARSHGLLDLGMRPNHAKISHGLAVPVLCPGPRLRRGPGFPGQGTVFLARGCKGKDSPCFCLLLNKDPPAAKPRAGQGPLVGRYRGLMPEVPAVIQVQGMDPLAGILRARSPWGFSYH
jgi:hypothetical protein